jgi:hypothetical protein
MLGATLVDRQQYNEFRSTVWQLPEDHVECDGQQDDHQASGTQR